MPAYLYQLLTSSSSLTVTGFSFGMQISAYRPQAADEAAMPAK